MIQNIAEHKVPYRILFIGLGALGLVFVMVWPNVYYQRVITAMIALFYFTWGITTHVKSKVLTLKIVLEYLVISLLAGSMLYLLTI